MPPKIHNIKEPLNLNRLRLAKPTNKNGSYFIKTLDVDDPIYFLGPKCFSKQGFVKSGKKIFCDLVFSNEDSDFLAWLDNLEESARKSIYNNRETWFETPLDEHDIESSMSSPYKPYKSGKFFIVRANVPTALDKINIKVYDENETETDPENIKENTKVLAVLEFQGIRCSVRSFQFEIELKQLLIVEPEKLFETCIISKATKSVEPIAAVPIITKENPLEETPKDNTQDKPQDKPQEDSNLNTIEEIQEPIIADNSFSSDAPTSHILKIADLVTSHSKSVNPIDQVVDLEENIVLEQDAVEILNDDNFTFEDITESNTNKEPPLRLKSRNDVYYKLYKEMRQRAKEAKREALANYLEAKRIKSTYLLENLSESESDGDLEDLEMN